MSNSIVLWRPQPDNVYTMDCFDLMRAMPPQSVDAIITDLPYGTTACSWDEVIPFAPMWKAVKRILKPRGVFVTTASQPFTSKLIMSNLAWFKYCWYWHKNLASNFAISSKQPLRAVEEICVFYAEQPIYNPQPTKSRIVDRQIIVGAPNGSKSRRRNSDHASDLDPRPYSFPEYVLPRNVLEIECVPHSTGTVHPTQKPVDLFRYLIRTYTQPGDLVLDPCCGSGTTAVAARNEGRQFIVGDSDPHYCNVARERLRQPYERHYVTKESAPLNELPLFAMEAS